MSRPCKSRWAIEGKEKLILTNGMNFLVYTHVSGIPGFFERIRYDGSKVILDQ